MASQSRAFRQMRITLAANILTPVYPPEPFRKVMIGNGSATDVLLYTNSDLSEYRIISASFERQVEALTVSVFRTEEIAFWLLSVQGGLVICEWS